MKVHKLKPKQLEIGQKYFLIDYTNDKIVEALFYSHEMRRDGSIDFDFKHSFSNEGEDYDIIHLKLSDGVLKDEIAFKYLVECPIFMSEEEAEANKNKYILKSYKAVRSAILTELKDLDEKYNYLKFKRRT